MLRGVRAGCAVGRLLLLLRRRGGLLVMRLILDRLLFLHAPRTLAPLAPTKGVNRGEDEGAAALLVPLTVPRRAAFPRGAPGQGVGIVPLAFTVGGGRVLRVALEDPLVLQSVLGREALPRVPL